LEVIIKKLDVVAAVIKENDRYFVAKRPDSSHLGGKWEFPGGKIEDGETHQEAIKREMMEEFCVEIDPTNLIGDILHQYPDKLIHLFFYNARISNGEITPTEHPQICWADTDKLLDIGLAEGDFVFTKNFLA